MSAYQLGCDALVALGQAEPTSWGAIALHPPALPPTLPRWDDICVVIISLAIQTDKLTFLRQENSSSLQKLYTDKLGAFDVPHDFSVAPNIEATEDLGPALAHPTVLPVLQKLGLLKNRRWTEKATEILWREQPNAWNLNITSDDRFQIAVQRAVEQMPDNVRLKLDDLTSIERPLRKLIQARKDRRALHRKSGEQTFDSPSQEIQYLRERLLAQLTDELDWLFFRSWRFSSGWLSGKQQKTALEIFHDPLAIQMRHAVVKKLFPDRPEFFE